MRSAYALLVLMTSACASTPSAEPVVAARLELPSPSERWRLLDWSGYSLCELPCEHEVVGGMNLEGSWSPWWSWNHRVTFVSIPPLREEWAPVVLIPHSRVGSPNGALALGITATAIGTFAGLGAWSSCTGHQVDAGWCSWSASVAVGAGAALVSALVWGVLSHEGYVEVKRAPRGGTPADVRR